MSEVTEDISVIAIVAEIANLQNRIDELKGQLKGHQSHVMDILVPNACNDNATCDDRTYPTEEFGIHTVRVSHKHGVNDKLMSQRYPVSKRPELWKTVPDTKMVNALLPRDKVVAMYECHSPYLRVE